MMSDLVDYRVRQRDLALADKGGLHLRCDMCNMKIGSKFEYHEIVSRGRTISNDVARKRTFHRHICSCLCPSCHRGSGNSHTPAAARKLLERNIFVYGREKVEEALLEVREVLGTNLDIELEE